MRPLSSPLRRDELRVIGSRGYIMPPMSPMPPGGIAGVADLSSGFSATIASVVISRPATEAA